MKIGILVHDNGEFDAFVAYFADPERLKEVVKQLNDRYFYAWDHDPVKATAVTMTLGEIPEVIDDTYLDKIATILEDEAGVEIEMSGQRNVRLVDELDDADEDGQPPVIQPPVAPGQVTLSDILKED
jgi:hypothetical protein